MSGLLWVALAVAVLAGLFLFGLWVLRATSDRLAYHEFWFVPIQLAGPPHEFAAACCCGWRGVFAYTRWQQTAAQVEYRRHLAERTR